MFKWNIFGPKAGVPNIAENLPESKVNKEEKNEAKEEENNELELESSDDINLEQELQELEDKKEEVSAINEERLEYYNSAKQFEEKMESLGLSEEKKKEIKEKILKEGSKISEKIQNIRDEYGFKPSPVEVYSLRFKMLKNEAKRIEDNLNIKYRELKNFLDKNGFYNISSAGTRMLYSRIRYLSDMYADIDEVREFVHKIENSKFNTEKEDLAFFDHSFEEFVNTLDKKIDEGSLYKTPGDVKDATERLAKVNNLLGMTELSLDEAMNKEGRFDNSDR